MENASKALIIAGSILLAILIISFGIIVLNQAKEIGQNNAMSDVEKTAFNSKFTQYEGTVKGAQVNALLQQIITSNSDENNEERQVTVESSVVSLGEGNDSIATRAKTSNTYEVTCKQTKGIVTSVKIDAAKAEE